MGLSMPRVNRHTLDLELVPRVDGNVLAGSLLVGMRVVERGEGTPLTSMAVATVWVRSDSRVSFELEVCL